MLSHSERFDGWENHSKFMQDESMSYLKGDNAAVQRRNYHKILKRNQVKYSHRVVCAVSHVAKNHLKLTGHFASRYRKRMSAVSIRNYSYQIFTMR